MRKIDGRLCSEPSSGAGCWPADNGESRCFCAQRRRKPGNSRNWKTGGGAFTSHRGGEKPPTRACVATFAGKGKKKLAEAGGRERDIRFEVAHTARQAVDGADIICTVTSAREPVLEGAWLADGVHVNLVGASVAAAREADDEVVTRSKFFVDFSRRPTNRRANCVTRCRRAWLKNAMFWVKSAKC